MLPLWLQILLLAGTGLLFAYASWRQKRYHDLPPPLLSPMLVQVLSAIVFVIVLAHMVATLTGANWSPPRGRL